MLTVAIQSLALSILVVLACVGLLALIPVLADYINQRLAAFLCLAGCAALVAWAISFVAGRWPAIH